MLHKTMVKKIFFTALIMSSVLTGGCGRKGNPVPPYGQTNEFPGKYPKDYDE